MGVITIKASDGSLALRQAQGEASSCSESSPHPEPAEGRGRAKFFVPIRKVAIAAVSAMLTLAGASPAQAERPRWAIVIHGGAGVIERAEMKPEVDAAYRAAMKRAVDTGSAVLEKGGSALDAVEAVIRGMEDDPLFNAGRGAVLTAQGRAELDAAIMDGRTLNAGAVAAVTTTRHPISLARRVMETSGHVMLIGAGADAFSKAQGLEQVDNSWFVTERRWKALEDELKRRGEPVPARPAALPAPSAALEREPDDHRFGTVGVAALDRSGALAVGTSTGGTTAKRWGRVGDTPVIGAGTYADARCAVSGTGKGEYFIRLTVAREICALHQYRGMSLQAAADEVIQKRMPELMDRDGGVIALAADGTIAWSFNTSGMYRARAIAGQAPVVSIFAGEP
jgi:L-asparaginase / beta-aspartyl-peptidase